MKILTPFLMSLADIVKSSNYHSIANSTVRLDVIQIAYNESVTATTQQSVITGRWIEISAILIFISIVTAHQKLKGNLHLIEQINEMEKTIGELNRLNSVKDILLAIISHDVRAPLVSLQSLLELVVTRKLTPYEFTQLVAEINDHVGHAKGFLENLLYWSKENFSKLKPTNDKLFLYPLVKEAISLLSFSAKKKLITIHTDVSSEVVVYADAEMIKLVLRNLISNAIKFSNAKDKIYIRATFENEMVMVSVKDTGQGISEKNIATLFSMSHLSAKGTDDEIGVGLGLTLCKEFVEKMGGKISVLSKEGEGSCFQFTVPQFIQKEPLPEATQLNNK